MTQQWISVNERLPEKCEWVLCITAKGPAFVGQYTKGHEIEYWDDNYDGEYDEVEDKNGTLYLKPGWYECEEQTQSEYDEVWMSRIVTHWMPLPDKPGSEPDSGSVSFGTPCTFNVEEPNRVEPI